MTDLPRVTNTLYIEEHYFCKVVYYLVGVLLSDIYWRTVINNTHVMFTVETYHAYIIMKKSASHDTGGQRVDEIGDPVMENID